MAAAGVNPSTYDDTKSEESDEEDKTCIFCHATPRDKYEAYQMGSFYDSDDGSNEGYGCRNCISFCERCDQSRRANTVTWFDSKDADGRYSACEKCWKSSDDARST
jgi:hypothetical protein